MIINISGRTDIINHYSDWMFHRFSEGYVLSRNSLFPRFIRRYELTPDKIDCIIFGSKNYAPAIDRLSEITDRYNTYFYYTITAYGKDVEPLIPDIDSSINTLYLLEKIVGANKIAWRYDPVLLTEIYTIEKHIETFEYMCQKLTGHIDRCIFSFVEMYKKHKTNFPELIEMTYEQKDYLAAKLGGIAKKYNITLQTCGPEAHYADYGINKSECVTLDILGNANNIQFRNLKHKGFRDGCGCMQSRDIGALNCCPNGCKYCYANKSQSQAIENNKKHDPMSPLLIGYVQPNDEVGQGSQKSFLKKK